MRARVLLAFVLMTAFVLALVELPLGLTYASRQQERLLADIERDARVLGSLIEEQVERGDVAGIATTVNRYDERTGGRVVVTDGTGRSLIDSDADGEVNRDFSTRPEIITALDGGQSVGVRPSETLGDDLAYAAVPIASDGRVAGAVRISFETSTLQQQVRDNWIRLGLLSVLVLAASAALGWIISTWVIRPISELRRATTQLSGGDLQARSHLDHGPPELVELGATFNTMAERIEALVASQDAFVADASHQLRTPLTAMRIRLDNLDDLVTEHPDDRAAATGEIDALVHEVDRLNTLVEALLSLARAGDAGTALASVDVADLVRDAALRWEPLATERNVAMRAVAPDHAPVMAIDGGVEQVLDNLIDNALEVAPAGSAIELTVRTAPSAVQVIVRDHGPGMDAASRERALDRFWRAPGAAGNGSGLGLAIVAELVRASGGSIELLTADDGPGLVVAVTLSAERVAS